jgi:phosphate transport system protein
MTPSHYQERLEADLNQIRERVTDVGARVQKALADAVHAVLNRDEALAYRIVLGDLAINRAVQSIDRLCHAFVARHLPSAGHLRFISAVLRINIELERAGDYAVTISRESIQLSQPLSTMARRELERMSKDAFQMLRQSLRAFHEGNADLAKGTMSYASQVERTFGVVFDELLDEGRSGARPLQDLFATFAIFNRIERVGDKAKNVCEHTVFAATGEMKKSREYRILFIDAANDYYSQIAVAFARRAYPESGRYESAGARPAQHLDATFVKLMEEHGHEIQRETPRGFDWVDARWSDFDVIVSLDGPVHGYVEEIPFRTIALEWSVPPRPEESSSGEEARARFEEIYREIAARVRDLMETLRGDDAS